MDGKQLAIHLTRAADCLNEASTLLLMCEPYVQPTNRREVHQMGLKATQYGAATWRIGVLSKGSRARRDDDR